MQGGEDRLDVIRIIIQMMFNEHGFPEQAMIFHVSEYVQHKMRRNGQ